MGAHPTPQTIAGTRREMIDWFRTYAPQIWPQQHLGGSKFVAPPCLPPIRAKVAGYELNPRLGSALHLPDEPSKAQFKRLAEYYAQTFERARTYYVGPDLSHLALRTEMEHFRLTLDMLPSPSGFLVWALPVGAAEAFIPRHSWVDQHGNLTEVDVPDTLALSPFHDVDSPVIGVSWNYEESDNSVWVVFFTRNDGILGKMAEGFLPHELARMQEMGGPISFEREQRLPLDQTLGWFDADPEDGAILPLTAAADIESLPEHLKQIGVQANADILPSMTQMVRTLVATFLLMKWKIVNREEIAPAPYVVREIAQSTGQTKAEAKAGNKTVFVRLGQPLKHRKPKEGGKSGKWKVRAIIGPTIRTRQYIPATGEFDFTPRLIAPYIAGPEGAPFSDAANNKVFLLD
jgi:hypothetical protein